MIRCAGLILGTIALGAPAPEPVPATPAVQRSTIGGERDRPTLSVEVGASSTSVTVADRVVLTVRVRSTPGARLEWAVPETGKPLGDFTVQSVARSPSRLDDRGLREDVTTIVLEPYLPGSRVVPPMEFSLAADPESAQGPDSPEVQKIRTEPIAIEVRSVLDASTDHEALAKLSAPKGPVEMREGRRREILLAGGAAGVLALLAGIGVLSTRRLRRARPVIEDPATAARRELQAAREEAGIVASVVDRTLADRVALALRRFAGSRFDPAVADRTVEELGTLVERKEAMPGGLDHRRLAELCAMLGALDRERFAPGAGGAGGGADANTLRGVIEDALAWVDRCEESGVGGGR